LAVIGLVLIAFDDKNVKTGQRRLAGFVRPVTRPFNAARNRWNINKLDNLQKLPQTGMSIAD
jgi:hypothetical protein